MDRVHDYSRYLQQCEAVSEQMEQHLGEYKKPNHIHTEPLPPPINKQKNSIQIKRPSNFVYVFNVF